MMSITFIVATYVAYTYLHFPPMANYATWQGPTYLQGLCMWHCQEYLKVLQPA